jgi:membrane protein DedA with SNARE-associated domain/rhodanese-related sulfurtransferase
VDEFIQFLLRHGSLVLFAAVFAEQMGLPLPAIPFLIGAGALAGTANMNLALAFVLPLVAALAADWIWFELGRRRGLKILNLLCRISLEPDSCVRRTENLYIRHGVRSLLVAKFIPGLSTVAPPLAGIFGMSTMRFLWYDGLGALLWTVVFVLLGYIFSNQLEIVAEQAADFGNLTLVILVSALALYVVYKYVQRQRLLRRLRMARITPEELKGKLDAGEKVTVVDLRPPVELEANPYWIPGAIRISVEDLDERHQEIPRDSEIVLYCACPNEVTSARMALLLCKKGIRSVRPLLGGIDGWRERNFPLEQHQATEPVTVVLSGTT